MIKHLKTGISIGLIINFIARDSVTSLIAASIIILSDVGLNVFNLYTDSKDKTFTTQLEVLQAKVNEITLRLMGR
jgi:hypothetical protein